MEYNILLSTIKDFDSHTTIRYYYSKHRDRIQFCDAMAAGEAGAKHVLSRVNIDEIIAIGSDLQAVNTENQQTMLREGIDFYQSDVYSMSDFDFFRYRLVQFLEGWDIEAADLYGSVAKERQDEIIAKLADIFGSQMGDVFYKVSTDNVVWDEVANQLGELNASELEWVKRYLYHQIREEEKARPTKQNSDIKISFIPISRIGFDRTSMQNIANLTAALRKPHGDIVHLYVDIHGFSHEENFIFMSLIQALSDNPSNHIVIEAITSIGALPKGFLYQISNARERYKVEMLLSGVNAFINYGKADLIRDYWQATEIKNDYIDQLMYAMDAVDAGVSLCNTDELERGIYLLRKLIHTNIDHTGIDQEEENFILALHAGIINDYGQLVDTTSEDIDLLELVKWAFSKGFYQQTITIIESRLPADIIKRGLFYYAANEEDKLAYLKALNSHYWDSSQKDRYIFQNPAHYFIKYYGRFMTGFYPKTDNRNMDYALIHADQVFNTPPELLKAYSLLENKEDLITLLTAYYDISSLRNDINHANKKESEEETAINYTGGSRLKQMYYDNLSRFIRLYTDMASRCKMDGHSICIATPEETNDYTAAHGPKDDPECFQAPGYIVMRERKKKK